MSEENTSPIAAWESLFRAQVTVMRQLAAEFPSHVLSLNEYDVLFNLTISPNRSLRIRELNEVLLLTQPSISRMIDRLAARELVTKHADPNDGRGTIVEITTAGRTLFREAAVIHAESISTRMASNLDPDELNELDRLCKKLRHGVLGH